MNTAPTLSGFASNLAVDENADPRFIDSDVTFADAEGNFAGGRLVVSGLLGEDRVAILAEGGGAGQITVSRNAIFYGRVMIGTFAGGVGGDFTVTLNGSATSDAVQRLIERLTYDDVSDTPTATRMLTLNVTDAAGADLRVPGPAHFTQLSGAADPFTAVEVGYSSAPAFVDLDGDGRLDAVVGGYRGTLTSYHHNADGSFTQLTGTTDPFAALNVGSGAAPTFVDLDGDGRLDAVIGDADGMLSSFHHNADGSFTQLAGAANPFAGVDVGTHATPTFVDLDGDGRLDAVIGEYHGSLKSFHHNADGSFTQLTGAANPFAGVDVGYSGAPAFVDLDGDGRLDAVIGGHYGTLSSFHNNADGSFTEVTGASNPLAGIDVGYDAAPTFVDLDGDGDLDAVVGDLSGHLASFKNDAGQILPAVTVTVAAQNDAPILNGFAPSLTVDENAAPQIIDSDVTFADAEGNFAGGSLVVSGLLGEDRVAIRREGSGAGQIGVSGSDITYGGVTIGTFAGGTGGDFTVTLNGSATSAAVERLIERLTYADVSDNPTATRRLTLDLTDAAGAGLATPGPTHFTQLSAAANPFAGVDIGSYAAPAFADLDGDGRLDMVVGEEYGTLRSFHQNADGSFTQLAGAADPFAGIDFGYAAAPAFVDLDGDGRLDAVIGDAYGKLNSFHGNGDGSFTQLAGAADPFAGVDVGYDAAPAFVDLDGDGRLDAVVGDTYGTLSSFHGNADGSFTQLTGTANAFAAVNVGRLAKPAFVDLDGDGRLDAVIGGQYGTLASFHHNADGSFTQLIGAENSLAGIDVGYFAAPTFVDLDGDGDLDAVIGDNQGHLTSVTNDGTLFLPAVTVTVTAENDAPTLTNFAPKLTVDENAAPQFIDADVTFADAGANFAGGSLVVSGLLGEDRVTIRDEGSGAAQIGVSGANVTYGGVTIGSFAGGVGGDFTVTLNDRATSDAVDRLIERLTYADVSDTPTATRTLTLNVTDAAGADLGSPPLAHFTQLSGAANPFAGIDVGRCSAPAFVDLDGDGRLDVVVGELYGTFSSFHQNADGTFTRLTGAADPLAAISVGQIPVPTFVDLDRDGRLDLVVGTNDGTISSFHRAADGSFIRLTGAADPFAGINVGSYAAPAFVDLDGDGRLDAVIGNRYSPLSSFHGNADGSFTQLTGAANPFAGADVGYFARPTFVDLDGDGRLDAVVAAYGKISSFHHNADGSFTELTGASNPFAGVDVGRFAAPTFVDLDGDGDLDAVIGNYDGNLTSFTNDGKPVLPAVTVTVTAENDVPTLTGFAPTLTVGENAAPQIIDGDVTFADADGYFAGGSLVVSGLLGEDRVAIRSEGSGAGQIGVSGSDITYGGVMIGIFGGGVGGDFRVTLNGHATSDAVDRLIERLTYANVSDNPAATRALTLDVTDAAGAHLGGPQPAHFTELSGAVDPLAGIDVGYDAAPAFVDLDNDGRLDAVVGGADGRLSSFHGNANGSFTRLTGAADPFAGISFGSRATPAFVDFDGDGRFDAVVGSHYGTLSSFHGNADGSFAKLAGAANPFVGVDVGSYSSPTFVDLDNDGRLDVVVGEVYGTLSSFHGNANGSFTQLTGAANPFAGIDVGYLAKPAFVDLDGDGRLDAVVGNNYGTLSSFHGNADGSFTELTGAANPLAGVHAGYGIVPTFVDLDGDGDLDLVVGERYGHLTSFINDATPMLPAVTVTVTAQNDAPTASVTANDPTYTEDSAAVAPFSDFVVNTVEGGQAFTQLVLTVTNVESGHDALTIGGSELVLTDGATSTANGITASVSLGNGTATVTLSSSGTSVTVLEGLINSMGYRYDGENPSANDRVITITSLTDNGSGTDTATLALASTVHVTPVDDAGIAQNDAFSTPETTAIGAGLSLFVDNGSGADSDVDSALSVGAVNGRAASVGMQITLASGALLTVNGDGTFAYDPNGAFDTALTGVSGATNSSGTDSFTYTLAGGGTATATITIAGRGNDPAFGTAGDDVMTGTGADDQIYGYGGTDTIDGGMGDDKVFIGATPGFIDGGIGTDNLYILAGSNVTIGNAQIAGIENVYVYDGSSLHLAGVASGIQSIRSRSTVGGGVTIHGTNAGDAIRGGAGADTLDGGFGNDRISIYTNPASVAGGAGIDTLYVRGAFATFDDTSLTGIERILVFDGGSIDLTSVTAGFDLLRSTSTAGGGATILAGGGADVLIGGLGADTLAGGGGDDRITIFAQSADIDGGAGTGDVLILDGAATYTFDDTSLTGVERLFVRGGVTADLSGVSGGGVIRAIGTSGQHTSIVGTAGANRIVGGDGIDTIDGGGGGDVLSGGLGADHFVFSSLTDTVGTGGAIDHILDFSHADQDRIDLSQIDADPLVGGQQKFTFIGNAAFSGSANEVRVFVAANGNSYIQFDNTHDGHADYTIVVLADAPVTGSDIII